MCCPYKKGYAVVNLVKAAHHSHLVLNLIFENCENEHS
jgi:hypothetical protein